MPAFDLGNNDGFELTIFDTLRIEALDIGESCDGECGDFKVLRYKKEYLLFIMHEGLIRKLKVTQKSFKTAEELIKYLKK